MNLLKLLFKPDSCAEIDCKHNKKGKCRTTKEFTKDSKYPGELFCTSYKCRIVYQNPFGEVDQKGIISLNSV